MSMMRQIPLEWLKTRLKTLLKMADRISLAKDVVGDDAKAEGLRALKGWRGSTPRKS